MTAAEQAPHPRAGPAQAASNQPVSSSVEIDKTPQFHWVDIDPLPPSSLYSNRRRAFFRDLSERRLKRGVFGSVAALQYAVEEYIAHSNQHPSPYIWTAKAADILAKVTRARRKLDKLQSA